MKPIRELVVYDGGKADPVKPGEGVNQRQKQRIPPDIDERTAQRLVGERAWVHEHIELHLLIKIPVDNGYALGDIRGKVIAPVAVVVETEHVDEQYRYNNDSEQYMICLHPMHRPHLTKSLLNMEL